MPPRPHAGLGRRVGGRACDVIILSWLVGLVAIELGIDDPVVVLLALISFVLEVVPLAARGVTPGKVLLRERVVDARDGAAVGVAAAVLRWLVLYGPALIPLVGPVIVGANVALVVVHGRGLHDFAARTIVIRIDDSEETLT
ncbi:MAG: RDD family protein [Acidimicrobiales bacterium]